MPDKDDVDKLLANITSDDLAETGFASAISGNNAGVETLGTLTPLREVSKEEIEMAYFAADEFLALASKDLSPEERAQQTAMYMLQTKMIGMTFPKIDRSQIQKLL